MSYGCLEKRRAKLDHVMTALETSILIGKRKQQKNAEQGSVIQTKRQNCGIMVDLCALI